ncbi:MAG: glutamine--tRNA ligase/YqeY domain fusion protein [Phycisphaerae bacterium]|nr:glutamine--tRNA ligase/YqeY domain fusion protein [Phycisphaerae bacterium]
MSEKIPASDFIRNAVAEDIKNNRWDGKVVTRFPPEPNGYLHIGHAKAFGINFGIAEEFGGRCHLRFDDTNPTAEEEHYVHAIQDDVNWMGWDWGENLFFASDYFEQMYDLAVKLIKDGLGYVDDQSLEEIRRTRGSLTEPGVEGPYRNRPVEENLDLFERMKNGEFPDGSRVLRAKLDMASPNLNMRDPIMYRILHAHHHRQGDKWCVYPMYDWAHGLEDSIEGITHSLCSLEFENHRPLYDWFLDQLGVHHPQQIEFARLNMTYTVMSKRKLLSLVEAGHVSGWDDPRMPTLSGLRRRGYTPAAIREFLRRAGVNKFNSTVDVQLLEHCLRQDLNATSPRVMCVMDPLKVVITNYPEGQVDQLEAINNPEDASAGTREVSFTRELYIERNDFMEDAPKKFFRLTLGKEVRLRYAYFIICTDVIKDADGKIIELHCTYDPATRGGDAPDGRKVKGTLHWVSAEHSISAEVRLYEHLFAKENPEDVEEGADFTSNLNPDSLKVVTDARIEPSVSVSESGSRYQFERIGYFCVDADSTANQLVFNRTVSLKDTWAKMQKKAEGK